LAAAVRNFLARTAFYSFTFRRMKQKAYAAAGVGFPVPEEPLTIARRFNAG